MIHLGDVVVWLQKMFTAGPAEPTITSLKHVWLRKKVKTFPCRKIFFFQFFKTLMSMVVKQKKY